MTLHEINPHTRSRRSDLLIRPGFGDHLAIADLLSASSPFERRTPLPFTKLVTDSHHATRRPEFAEAARDAGIPYLVDPITYLWQSEVAPDHPWAQLPFGQEASLEASALTDRDVQTQMAKETVDFQLEQGASVIIPPYPYVTSVADPWFEIALSLVDVTASVIDDRGLDLQIAPVFCFNRRSMATSEGLALGVDRFSEVCKRHNTAFVGMSPSPSGSTSQSIGLVRQLFRVGARMSENLEDVVAWRLGGVGHALVAAGLSGYETGLNGGEQMDVARRRYQFRKRKTGSGGGSSFVYLQMLGRSIPLRSARVLFEDERFGSKMMCDDPACCATKSDTTGSNRRVHTVKARSRQLAEMDSRPKREWKLHQVSIEATLASALAEQANRLLDAAPMPTDSKVPYARIGTSTFDAVATVTKELSELS